MRPRRLTAAGEPGGSPATRAGRTGLSPPSRARRREADLADRIAEAVDDLLELVDSGGPGPGWQPGFWR
ncbi:hypothetical protein ABZU75_28545 [Streptosporangium sp. NPDC005286]|uniref:hypothetical protein n=1 Tax=Streptosporangium sp. NPDC005286 TaxID=3154463 RepID=UPI0033A6F1FE